MLQLQSLKHKDIDIFVLRMLLLCIRNNTAMFYAPPKIKPIMFMLIFYKILILKNHQSLPQSTVETQKYGKTRIDNTKIFISMYHLYIYIK